MPLQIKNLNIHSEPAEEIYFFDANIWLLMLGIEPNLKPYQVKYINYFKAVIKTKSVIILPALLVSEIINRKLHTEMSVYANKRGDIIDKTYFKQKYRSSQECIMSLRNIYDDLNIYSASCTLINDNFG